MHLIPSLATSTTSWKVGRLPNWMHAALAYVTSINCSIDSKQTKFSYRFRWWQQLWDCSDSDKTCEVWFWYCNFANETNTWIIYSPAIKPLFQYYQPTQSKYTRRCPNKLIKLAYLNANPERFALRSSWWCERFFEHKSEDRWQEDLYFFMSVIGREQARVVFQGCRPRNTRGERITY